MSSTNEELMEISKTLPDDVAKEALDFILFLQNKKQRSEFLESIKEAEESLKNGAFLPSSSQEIFKELGI